MNRYNAQSMTQLVETLQQLTQQQARAREQYSPSTPQGAAPQTPFQGLLSGVIGEHNRRREDVKLQEDAALKQSLAILDLIPDTPENTPKKLQLLTSILHPKTQKGWKEVWNPQADHTAQAEFLQKFAAQLPTEEVSANERAVAAQPTTSGPGAMLQQTARSKVEGQQGKFEFPDDGQYQGGQIIQTADGLVLVTFDKKTGEPKLKPLGQGKTEKQTVAEIRGKGGAAGDNNVMLKRAIGYAKLAALQDKKIPFSEFDKLQQTDPDTYFAYMEIGSAKAQELQDSQNAAAGLRVPYLQAKTAEALANEKRGGVTGGQAATIQRQDTQDTLAAKKEITDIQAELQQVQSTINSIWNGWKGQTWAQNRPDIKIQAAAKRRDPDNEKRYVDLQAKLGALQTKLGAAQERAKVVGRSVPRGGARITGNLDWDRVMRRGQQDTSGGQAHYEVVDPAPNVVIPKDFDIESFSAPTTPNGFINVGRSVKNPNLLLLNPRANPEARRVPLEALRPGGSLYIGGMSFQILQVSSDRSKVLVLKIPNPKQ
jgi:hypothetical protein